MNCLKCFNCDNNNNENEQDINIPTIIKGPVYEIITPTNIIVSYKIEQKQSLSGGYNICHYNVKLSNIILFPEKKAVAMKALSELILNEVVTVENINIISYNNIEGKVFYNNNCINNWLVYNKFAYRNP